MELETLKEAVVAEAEAFVLTVKEAFALELDYSEKSISYLDEIFENIRSELSENGITRTSQTGGCYIGETARRCGLGDWIDGSGDNIPEVMRQPILFQSNNDRETVTDPIAWVGKRLVNGPEDNIAFKFGMMGSHYPCELFKAGNKAEKRVSLFSKIFGKRK